jgi:hypothetical protein
MKDLIISCVVNYNVDKIKYWINSINKSGFNGDRVLISFGVDSDTEKFILENGFELCRYERTNRHIVVDRFMAMWDFIKNSGKKYRYVISTDVKDVVFQYNPSHWLEANMGQNKILVSSECLKYKNEDWGNSNLRSSYPHLYEDNVNNTIYNAGTMAGVSEYVKDFFLHIFNLSLLGGDPQPDQAAMNILIHTHPFSDLTKKANQEDGWCCQLGTTIDPKIKDKYAPFLLEPVPNFVNDAFINSNGVPYCLVHQYDRVPYIKEIIENKYAQ